MGTAAVMIPASCRSESAKGDMQEGVNDTENVV